MDSRDWGAGHNKSFSVFLNGEAIPSRGTRGERVVDDSFLVMFNAHYDALRFSPPDEAFGRQWSTAIDTTHAYVGLASRIFRPTSRIKLEGRSLLVLQRRDQAEI
jgi:isoamylase